MYGRAVYAGTCKKETPAKEDMSLKSGLQSSCVQVGEASIAFFSSLSSFFSFFSSFLGSAFFGAGFFAFASHVAI